MTVHLVKLCAGAQSIDDLSDRVGRIVAANRAAGRGNLHSHVTRMKPKRTSELLDGGSLYWVIKGTIQARQEIIAIEPRVDSDQIERVAIMLAPTIITTHAAPRRAFQGWRYLEGDDAPADLGNGQSAAPPALHRELAELGLL